MSARTERFKRVWWAAVSAAALAALLLTLVATAEKPATAAFPGENGKIAFISYRDYNDEIFTMNADGSNQTNIT